MRFILVLVLAGVGLLGCEGGPGSAGPGSAATGRHAVWAAEPVVLDSLEAAPFGAPEVELRASWGDGPLAFGRETVGAATGPMAIAAEAGSGFAVLDTVNGRVSRFAPGGALRASVPLGVETGDDLVVLGDGSIAVLAYRREPTPGHDLLAFGPDGTPRGRRPVPQAVTLPTALLADGRAVSVESRHLWVHPADGSPRLWGRPAGDLLLRATVAEGGLVTLTARERQGALAWQRSFELPWSVVEVLALEACDALVVIVLRGLVEPEGAEGPAWHETWAVALDRSGEPLGRLAVRDGRVTDSGRPFALARNGDLLELATDEGGVTVLRYRHGGGVR